MIGSGKRLVCLSVGLAMAATLLLSAPFEKTFTFMQPNGAEVSIWGRGDEFYAVFETLEGYTVLFDPQARAYVYAQLSPNGEEMLATELIAGQGDPTTLGVAKHLRLPPATVASIRAARQADWDQATGVSAYWRDLKQQRSNQRESMSAGPSLMAPPSQPTLGEKVGLCLLIDFDDSPATIPRAEILDFCNGESYTGYGNNGSIRQYFLDNSNNQLDFSNVVTLYVRIPNSLHPKSYYNDTTKNAGSQARQLIADAVAVLKAMPEFQDEIAPTFENLTTRGSDIIAACSVFYAGGNGGVWSYGLWPHSSSLGTPLELIPGKRIQPYQITNIGTALEIATFAHECGHMLCGFPDIYDYDYDSSGGAGRFCLMNSGTAHGKNPPQFCAYLKYVAGWATTVEVTRYDVAYATVAAEVGHPDFNRFYRFEKPDTPTEYYLFENRQKLGRDANIPGEGLAIWHIDELGDKDNQSLEYNTGHENYECTLVQADNRWDLQRNINSGDANDLYFEGNPSPGYANSFTDTTEPSARWWDGERSYLEARTFSAKGAVMTFVIEPRPPVMHRTGALPSGWVGTPYHLMLGASGGLKPYTWHVAEGALPDGVSLDEEGLLSGVPQTMETATFQLVVASDNGRTVTNTCSIAILPNLPLPLLETFETNGEIPPAWSQEVVAGDKEWSFREGSPNGSPLKAYQGEGNASLSINTGTSRVARLVSPMLDFGPEARAARVSFWHYMKRWASSQDELRVFYKTTWEDEWELVAAYTDSVGAWTQRALDLPQPSRTAYLAFEGTAQNGYGICLDDIHIWDPAPPLGILGPDELPPAFAERAYSHQLEAEGWLPPFTFSIVEGALPAGLTMDAQGLITGTAMALEESEFEIEVADAGSEIARRTLRLSVILPRADLFEEDFERRGFQIPFGWTQEYVSGSANWQFRNGGWDGKYPRQAQNGVVNAYLFAEWRYGMPEVKTRLITPWIDLGQAPAEIALTFWHYMRTWEVGQGELNVYYQNSPSGAWHLLNSYTGDVPVWTQRALLLPDPTSTYRIAFEGNARSGYGVCLDNIRITDASAAPVIRTSTPLPNGITTIPYRQPLDAAGGLQPYTWSVVSNALPFGLALDSASGEISGAPETAGLHTFGVSVAGADGKATTNLFTLKVVVPGPMPFREGFEHGGSIPEGWTQERVTGSVSWSFPYRSPNPNNPVPTSPYEGNHMACLAGPATHLTRLVTPAINLGVGSTNTKLTFQHCMAPLNRRQDELLIFYRTHSTNEWVFLTRFASSTPGWTERTVELPEPTPTYYIAFEGATYNSNGVCLDDVLVTGDFSPYLTWLHNHFTEEELAEGVIIDPQADPDGDGIPNGMEYAMGLDPRSFDAEGLPHPHIIGDHCYVTFRMDKEALDAGVIFEVESCPDLLNCLWTSLDMLEDLPRGDSNTWWQAWFRHETPVVEWPQRFYRVKVYLP